MTNEKFKELADKLRNVEAPIIDWFANTPQEMCLNDCREGRGYLNQLMTMLEGGSITDAHDINYTLDSIKEFSKMWLLPKETTTTLFKDYHFQPQGDLLSGIVDYRYENLAGSKYGRFSFSDLKETAQEYFIGRKKTNPEGFVEFLGLIKNGVSEDSSELITELVETYNAVNSEKLDINPEMLDAFYNDKLALSELDVKVSNASKMVSQKFFSSDNSGIEELNLYVAGVRKDYDAFVETYGVVKDESIIEGMEMINTNLQDLNGRNS